MPRSGHVRWLRERIGSALTVLPSVSVAVRDAHGRVLLIRHADGDRWLLPGGCVEPEEPPEEAAAREVEEEAGVVCGPLRLVAVLGGPDFTVAYANGDRTSYVAAFYEGRAIGGSARADGVEALEVRWCTLAEADALVTTPATLAKLRLLA
jgi:ADP-ribose pyrophosphatase YjhB (NUDIX family)